MIRSGDSLINGSSSHHSSASSFPAPSATQTNPSTEFDDGYQSVVSDGGLNGMSQRNSARALRTITAPLEAYTTFEPRRAPSLPLPVRFGSLFGNDPGGIVSVTTIRQYQRMITAYVQQVATRSGQLRNTSQCLFCMSLASKGLQNVFCDGIPCSNCRMALKLCLKIATTIATPVEPNLAPCVARTIEGAATSCSGIPVDDFHVRARIGSCKTCLSMNRSCISAVHMVIPWDIFEQIPLRHHSRFQIHSKQEADGAVSWIDPFCGRVFQTELELRYHLQILAFGNESWCERCGSIFGSASDLKKHMSAYETVNDGEAVSYCDSQRGPLLFPGSRPNHDILSGNSDLSRKISCSYDPFEFSP